MSRQIFLSSSPVTVIDQFSVFAADGITKVPDLNPSTTMVSTVYLNGVVQSPFTVTIAEISSPSGEYEFSFQPGSLGYWNVQIFVTPGGSNPNRLIEKDYDVITPPTGALPGEIFYDRVVDIRGNAIPYATVNVYLTGTSTLVTTVQTDYNGQYAIPLTGQLANPILVDLTFSGVGLQTFTKSAVRLL